MERLFSLLGVMILMGSSSSFAAGLQVTSGVCKLEASGEVIQIKNQNSGNHFGVFAEGLSSKKDRIYLTENFMGSVDINFQSNGKDAYSIVSLVPGGKTVVRSGIFVSATATTPGEWLTCDLVVE